MSRMKKFLLIGGSALAGLSGFGFYANSKRKALALDPTTLVPSKSIRTGLDNTSLKLTLFQYQSCPFCSKVRTYLNYHGFDYDIVEVHPLTRRQIQFSENKKLPMVFVETSLGENKQWLHDSSMIISILHTFLLDQEQNLDDIINCYSGQIMTKAGEQCKENNNIYHTMYNEIYLFNEEQVKQEVEWRKWADQDLVHMLSPNVYRTLKEALETCKKFAELANWEVHFYDWERTVAIYIGAGVMFVIGKMLKKKYKLKDDVRQSLYDSCDYWTIGLKGTYNGGETPNLADLAVFGILNSMEGTQAFDDMMRCTNIGKWYYNLKSQTEAHSGANLLKKKVLSISAF